MQTILFALVCAHLVLVAAFMVHTMVHLTRRRNASNGDGGLAVEAGPSGTPPPRPSHGIVIGSPESPGTRTVDDFLGLRTPA